MNGQILRPNFKEAKASTSFDVSPYISEPIESAVIEAYKDYAHVCYVGHSKRQIPALEIKQINYYSQTC